MELVSKRERVLPEHEPLAQRLDHLLSYELPRFQEMILQKTGEVLIVHPARYEGVVPNPLSPIFIDLEYRGQLLSLEITCRKEPIKSPESGPEHQFSISLRVQSSPGNTFVGLDFSSVTDSFAWSKELSLDRHLYPYLVLLGEKSLLPALAAAHRGILERIAMAAEGLNRGEPLKYSVSTNSVEPCDLTYDPKRNLIFFGQEFEPFARSTLTITLGDSTFDFKIPYPGFSHQDRKLKIIPLPGEIEVSIRASQMPVAQLLGLFTQIGPILNNVHSKEYLPTASSAALEGLALELTDFGLPSATSPLPGTEG